GSVTIPGTLTATSISRVIDVEEELGSSPLTTNTTPLAFYYGFPSPTEKPTLYGLLVKRLAECVNQRREVDAATRISGLIINTPGQFAEGTSGYDLLKQAIEEFSVNVILVIGHERLYSDLTRHHQDDRNMSIIKLAKSGGVVNRDRTYRRQLQNQKIREYFYGTPTANNRAELSPYTNVVPFTDVAVRRVGEGTLAPSSALPLGTDRKVLETRMVKIEAGDILLHSILAVSNASPPSTGGSETGGEATDPVPAMTQAQESQMLLETNLAGFVYV
ncbi:Cleavage polyadenylation factor subunit clp1, partial [Quaeritorhiza haematococci]